MALVEEYVDLLQLTCQRFGQSFACPGAELCAGMCQIDYGIISVRGFIVHADGSSEESIPPFAITTTDQLNNPI
jgi:hypothetical protein